MLTGYSFSSPGKTIQNKISSGIDKIFGTKGFGQSTKLAPNSTAGRTGELLGEASQFLGPGGAVKSLPFLAKTGANFAKNTVIATAQSGDLKEGLTTGALAEAFGPAGKLISSTGKALHKGLAIPLSAGEAKMVQAYKAGVPFMQRISAALTSNSKAPVTASESAFNKGLFGTESMIGVQAKKANKVIWDKIISPALKATDERINISKFFDEAEATIRKNNPEMARQNSLVKALNSLRDDYSKTKDVSIEELQKLKEGWAKFVPQKAYKGEDIAGAFNDVKNIISGQARSKIIGTINDDAVRQAYLDYGNLLGLQKWGQKAMTGGKFKGGTGGLLSAAKDAVLTPVATVGGFVLYKTGQGIA